MLGSYAPIYTVLPTGEHRKKSGKSCFSGKKLILTSARPAEHPCAGQNNNN